MKRTLFLGLALSVIATGGLMAQEKISVKGGNQFDYDLSATGHLTQSASGQEMALDMSMKGGLQMKAEKVGKDRIDWQYAVPKMDMMIMSDILPGGQQDTTISIKPITISSDMNGKLTDSPELRGQLQVFLSAGAALMPEQLFSPALGRSVKKGESWDVTTLDTMQNALMGSSASSMVTERTIRYTYDGPVDTLKTKTMRIRSEITSLNITGSGELMGMQLRMDGDGAGQTVGYYSVKEGVLVASTNTYESNMRVVMTGQMEDVMPITTSLNYTITRK